MMYLVFQVTFWLGNPLVDLLDGWKECLRNGFARPWTGHRRNCFAACWPMGSLGASVR